MPENQIPATQPESGASPAEFDFDKPAGENPRMKRRSLKAKPEGLIKPPGSALPAARELAREAPPLSAEQAQPVAKPQPQNTNTVAAKSEPTVRPAQTPIAAPPRTTPSSVSGSTVPRTASTSTPAASPHGTRPAALYYSSRKDKEVPSPMKTIPTANPVSSSSTSSTGTLPSSAARPATASPRPATTIDYRSNVERQSREQKSVGNILVYVVYALIGFFVLSAGLAGYGSYVIFQRLHDQSTTVSDLDARYAAANKDLTAKLAVTRDNLTQTQAQLAREQDLIVKQQEELNRIIAAANDEVAALKTEKQARTQETASLRARVRDLENRVPTTQKY